MSEQQPTGQPVDGDAAGEVAASELYRRMPEGGGSLGGSQTELVAETIEPSASASDWAAEGPE